jgi:hypothetical protein
MGYITEDEALARALQEEYEAEVRRSQRRRLQQQPVAAASYRTRRFPAPSAPPHPAMATHTPDEISDSEFARRLAQEEEIQGRRSRNRNMSGNRTERRNEGFLTGSMTDGQYSRQSHAQDRSSVYQSNNDRHVRSSSRSNYPPPAIVTQDRDDPFTGRTINFDETIKDSRAAQGKRTTQTPATSRSNSNLNLDENGGDALFDEELARRVEQELMDEDLAREFQHREQTRVSRREAQRVAVVPVRRCTWRRLCSCLIPLAIIAGAIVGVLFYFGIDKDDFTGWVPSPEDFYNEDPFDQVNPEDADRWRGNGQGLQMEILNALDDYWYPYFVLAVQQWDNGTPDALTLSTSIRSPEPNCEPVQGKLKVCNGNYGDTRWRGINQILLTNGYIIASSAKMNEFYLSGSGDDQMQYTMCHEIGHGFGLPHTDENFLNRDLGNCMDYTNNPQVNKQPDDSNFQFLADLYGNVTGTQSVASSEVVSDQVASEPGDGRALASQDAADRELPAWLLSAWRDLIPQIEQQTDATDYHKGWRVLHSSNFGEAHERDLGQGFTLQVHKLMVASDGHK